MSASETIKALEYFNKEAPKEIKHLQFYIIQLKTDNNYFKDVTAREKFIRNIQERMKVTDHNRDEFIRKHKEFINYVRSLPFESPEQLEGQKVIGLLDKAIDYSNKIIQHGNTLVKVAIAFKLLGSVKISEDTPEIKKLKQRIALDKLVLGFYDDKKQELMMAGVFGSTHMKERETELDKINDEMDKREASIFHAQKELYGLQGVDPEFPDMMFLDGLRKTKSKKRKSKRKSKSKKSKSKRKVKSKTSKRKNKRRSRL